MDSLGSRMKLYESAEAGRNLMPLLPIVARIDGRAFHSFTKGMRRPFCSSLSLCMMETTRLLVQETGACLGYTQSDEISLVWEQKTPESQVWFNGRVCKMTSQLGALSTLFFYRLVLQHLPEYAERLPTFDARVWNVPNRTEAANCILWRELDATKNSISMAAQAHHSHQELMGKNSRAKLDMLHEKGINWNQYPTAFKRGSYFQRKTTSTPISLSEIEKLPEKHQARRVPGFTVERSSIVHLGMPIFSTVSNREEVIFDGALPKTFSSDIEWPNES